MGVFDNNNIPQRSVQSSISEKIRLSVLGVKIAGSDKQINTNSLNAMTTSHPKTMTEN